MEVLSAHQAGGSRLCSNANTESECHFYENPEGTWKECPATLLETYEAGQPQHDQRTASLQTGQPSWDAGNAVPVLHQGVVSGPVCSVSNRRPGGGGAGLRHARDDSMGSGTQRRSALLWGRRQRRGAKAGAICWSKSQDTTHRHRAQQGCWESECQDSGGL